MVRVVSAFHKLAVEKLRANCTSRDFVSGEVFISVRDCHSVLGMRLRVPKVLQNIVIDELKELGLVEVVGKRHIKINDVE